MQNTFQSLNGFQPTTAVKHKRCIFRKCREKALVEIGNACIVKCKMIDMRIVLHKFRKTVNTAHPIEENAINIDEIIDTNDDDKIIIQNCFII